MLLARADLDVCDRGVVLEVVDRHRPEVIIHAAAYTKVDLAESEPDLAREVNVDASRWISEAATGVGALLVYPSTDYVFRGDKGSAYIEEDTPDPQSVYGTTKLEGERIVSAVPHSLIVRTSWVFGEGNNFIRTILQAARARDELTVVADQIGLPTYAFDLAEGLLDLVDSEARGLFHLAGGGDPTTWADLAEAAVRHAGLSTKVRRVTTSEYYAGRSGKFAPRPANSTLDCSKAASISVSLRPWADAVAEFVKERT